MNQSKDQREAGSWGAWPFPTLTVVGSFDEYSRADDIGRRTVAYWAVRRGRDPKASSRSSISIEVDGKFAEIVTARVCGTSIPDREIGEDDGGFDFVLGKTRVQVKGTRRDPADLLITSHDRMNWDLAILARLGRDFEVELMGWVERGGFNLRKRWKTDVPKPCWTIDASDLRPISSLFWVFDLHPVLGAIQ
jgi:hypothetical protein